MSDKHILDPLWITKGSMGLDPEYSKYLLLAANQKYRDQLNSGDTSSFYEILFHALNLNNLAVEGSMFKFNMQKVLDDPELMEIRRHLRQLYQLPSDLIEIFKNANFLLTELMLDHLELMLELTDKTKAYFVNPKIHMEKEIYIILNNEKNLDYDIWKLKTDKRFKFGHKLSHVKVITLTDLKEGAMHSAITKDNDPELLGMNPDTNVMCIVMNKKMDKSRIADAIASSLIFSRGVTKDVRFEPNILNELYDLLNQDRVLPFTMESWNQ